jgi:hypothetical protein
MPRQSAKKPAGEMSVLFENARVRVVEMNVKKGSKAPMHTHPAYLVYSVTPFEYKSKSPSGRSELRKMKRGEVEWSEGESHEVVFQRPARAVVIELK